MSCLGKDIPHDSAPGHVSGSSIFIDDLAPVHGELLVDFYYLPVSHAKINSIDLSLAKTLPNIAGLFTYKDLDGGNLFGPIMKDEILLVEDIVQFMGQPLIVIAGETKEAIENCKQAIKINYEILEAVLTIDEAKEKKLYIGPSRQIKRGNITDSFRNAEHTLEGEFVCAGQDHFYLESQAVIVYPKEYDQLEIHSSTQHPSEVQETVAHLLGLNMNQVVCITKRMGGGFGGKECQATHPAVMASLVAHKLKRPARMVYTKDHDMQVTGKRHPFKNSYKVAFNSDGLITALKVDLFSNGGAANDLSTAVMARAMTHIDNAYYLENVEITGSIAKTNLPPNTAFRGFGGPQGIATIENILEEIAYFLGKDPLDVRLKNLYGTKERNITPYGEIVYNNTLPEIFAKLETSSNYRSCKKNVDEFNQKSKSHCKGIALTAVKFGISFNTKFLNQANALVNIYLDGSIQVSTGATEMGQGVNTNIKQIVANEFAIDPKQVIMMPTSTEKNNNTSATAASAATDLNGSAALNACQQIKERLTLLAAQEIAKKEKDIQASPTSIIFENSKIYDIRRPNTKLDFKELIKLAYLNRISLGERGFYATQGLDWSWDTGPDSTASGNPFLYYTMGAAVSQVLIDRFTGELKVEKVDLLMDIGKPINPGIARGQIIGAFIQGMGWVTTEYLKYDKNGLLLTHSPTTYKIPNIQDIPEILNLDWLDKENPVNLKGTKAVGEPPLVLAISVWMAIKNALAASHSPGSMPKLELPATNEEIIMHLTNGKTNNTIT